MNKYSVEYPYNRIVLSNEKEETPGHAVLWINIRIPHSKYEKLNIRDTTCYMVLVT